MAASRTSASDFQRAVFGLVRRLVERIPWEEESLLRLSWRAKESRMAGYSSRGMDQSTLQVQDKPSMDLGKAGPAGHTDLL